ncbi:MAG: flavoprotein oxygenase family protein [Vampirovibrio sp.]|jgi:flavin reductase (DIM6/NTAB) family NADH-FMN oxidoreductase RutF|nr:flavoprotein oxygenase family protein [Vampirovibrio sp.]
MKPGELFYFNDNFCRVERICLAQEITDMAEQLANKEGIGAAIGRIPSGVFIITAKRGEQKIGMMGSWVAQAGFEPPCISVAVHPDREIYSAIEQSGSFCVNVLSNENMNLMKAFSRYSPDQFDGVPHTETEYGLALDEAVAVMHCKLKSKCEAADHHLFIGEVVDGTYLNHEEAPMVHLRKSGFNY